MSYSNYSNTANATTLGSVPNDPTNLIGYDYGVQQASLDWNAVTPMPSNYIIEWSDDPSFAINVQSTSVVGGLTHEIIFVGTPGIWNFRVYAQNPFGVSGYSNPLQLPIA